MQENGRFTEFHGGLGGESRFTFGKITHCDERKRKMKEWRLREEF